MRIKIATVLLLGLVAVVAVLPGCGAAPTPQPSEVAASPAAPKVVPPTAAPSQPAPASKTSQTESVPPKVGQPMNTDSDTEAVEVGYKVGMQAPEFGMSLLDGTSVTTAKLVEQGKPAFIYFHATW